MREIKFRAFDTKNKRWLCGYEKLGGFDIMGECIIFGEWASQLGPIDQWNDIAVMQYTGLKDKDGKEIYEGDRVSCCINGEIIGEPDSIGFEEGSFFLRNRYRTISSWLNEGNDNDNEFHLIVIGNIYQTPELLTP